MDAISMLKEDHTKVKGLFLDFESAGEAAFERKQAIAEKAFAEIEVHSLLEQEIFYPAVSAADPRGADLVDQAIEAHRVVKDLITELRGIAPIPEAQFKVLMENVRHHIEEEEGEMFPHAGEQLGDTQLSDLGREMRARKHALNKPGLLSQTFHQAKKVIADAVEALTAPPKKRSAPRARTRVGRGTRTGAKQPTRRAARSAARQTPAGTRRRRRRTAIAKMKSTTIRQTRSRKTSRRRRPPHRSANPIAGNTTGRRATAARSKSRKSGSRRYGKKASQKVERAMHELKRGSLRSGRSGKKVTSRKQAIAIGLSEARKTGGKVPRRAARSR